jgi:hypothetical protein
MMNQPIPKFSNTGKQLTNRSRNNQAMGELVYRRNLFKDALTVTSPANCVYYSALAEEHKRIDDLLKELKNSASDL